MPRQLTILTIGAVVGSLHIQPAIPAHAQPPPTPDAPAPDASAPSSPETTTPAPDAPDASAPPATAASTTSAPTGSDDEVGDQAISAELGLAAGGRATPGGLRIAGRYVYQLSERDWFDGAASFTFGSGRAACFRDRSDQLVCSHGLADGAGVEVVASIRRLFAPQGSFRPFARVGLGVGLARFGDDDVSGATLTAHGGGGMRVKLAPAMALVAAADLALGVGSFSRSVGGEPQLGFAVTAGVEFRLR